MKISKLDWLKISGPLLNIDHEKAKRYENPEYENMSSFHHLNHDNKNAKKT